MHDNERIALAVDAQRKGWAWKACDAGCYCAIRHREGEPPVNYRNERHKSNHCCSTCAGTGRTPVDLAEDAYTLKLEHWFRTCMSGPWPSERWFRKWHRLTDRWEKGRVTPEQYGERRRNLVASALKEQKP